MKQANVEDDHPADGVRAIPVAPAVLGGPGAVTLTGNASSFVPLLQPTGKGKWVAALVGVALIAGVAGRLLSSSSRAPDGSTPAATSSTAGLLGAGTGKPADAHAPTLVTVKVAASPADAEILLDGAKLDGNPFVGQFPKDPALHRLELRCLGRRTEARMINLDQDLDLLIALEPDVTRPGKGPFPGSASASGRSTTGAKHPNDAPPATNAPGSLTHKNKTDSARPIDDTDPYAN
jgi:hypothetical protein